MKNKFKSVAIAVVLGIFGIFAGLGLSGCGGSLSTLKSEYATMQKKIASYSEVFSEDTIDGISTKLKVNYGADAEAKIGADNLDELQNKYNSILVISNDYIEQNIQVIQNMNQKKLSKSAKKAVKKLCKDIKDFTKYLKTFATSRKGFNDYFHQMITATQEDIESKIVVFKKSYGKLVQKNIAVAMDVAKCMETTQIYSSLKTTTADGNTLKIIRDYARTKMLPIFSKFMLTETANQFIWKNYNNKTDTMREIDSLLTLTEDIYTGSFKSSLVSTSTPSNSNKSVKELFDMVDEFLKEADCYINALDDLDIKELAVGYEGNMTKYLKDNKLAERDLYKIDQFLKITLPNFITNFSAALR